LLQAPFEIRRFRRYAVRFGARADARRRIGCMVGQNHAPWRVFSPYLEVEVDSDWRSFECPFVANGSDSNARIVFDLATSDVPVDLRNVVLRDLSSGRDVAPARQFLVDYRFNSLGFRGPDYAIPIPEGTFRVLALGDSYTLGAGLYEPDTFAAQLENRLNAAAGAPGGPARFEVVNGGVSGYSTEQERISYELFSSAYTPQVVLLTVVSNDDLSYVDEMDLGYVSSSEELSVSNLWARLDRLRRPERVYDYSATVREILRLQKSCRERGAGLAVVIFRHAPWEPWPRLVRDVTEGLRGTSIPVLDLGQALLEGHRPDELTVHPTDGHPNEIAHRLAAEEIERFLRTEGLLPS
jgi:lysophospholipase L1-like esterase